MAKGKTDPLFRDLDLPEEAQDGLRELAEECLKHIPDLGEIAKSIKEGKISEEDAIAEMMGLALDPRVSTSLTRIANEKGGDLRVFQPPHEGAMAKMNPLFAAELLERLQFDGDVPELRTAPLQPGQKPAVPVETKARSAVAIGMMLQEASEGISKELRLLSATETPLEEDELTEAVTGQIEVSGYRTGEVASLRRTRTPNGSALAKTSRQEQQQSAWSFISTTQGRRSAVPQILSSVTQACLEKGYELESLKRSPKGQKPVFGTHWSIGIHDGEASINPKYPFVEVAVKALSLAIIGEIEARVCQEKTQDGEWSLLVTTLDNVKSRKVGWSAYLYLSE